MRLTMAEGFWLTALVVLLVTGFRAWRRARKYERWEEHGDFCHCKDCDRD